MDSADQNQLENIEALSQAPTGGLKDNVIGIKNIDFLWFKIDDFHQHIENYFALSISFHFLSLIVLSFILAALPLYYLLQKQPNITSKVHKIVFLYLLTLSVICVCLSSIHLYFCLIVLYGDTIYIKARLFLYGGLAFIYFANAYLFIKRSEGKSQSPIFLLTMSGLTICVTLAIFMLSLGMIDLGLDY